AIAAGVALGAIPVGTERRVARLVDGGEVPLLGPGDVVDARERRAGERWVAVAERPGPLPPGGGTLGDALRFVGDELCRSPPVLALARELVVVRLREGERNQGQRRGSRGQHRTSKIPHASP